MATSILTRDDVEALIPDAPTQTLRTLRNEIIDAIIKTRDAPNEADPATELYDALDTANSTDYSSGTELFDYTVGQYPGPYHWRVIKHLGRIINSVVVGATSTTQAEYGTYIGELLTASTDVLGQIAGAGPQEDEGQEDIPQ